MIVAVFAVTGRDLRAQAPEAPLEPATPEDLFLEPEEPPLPPPLPSQATSTPPPSPSPPPGSMQSPPANISPSPARPNRANGTAERKKEQSTKSAATANKIQNLDFQDAEIGDVVRTISQLTGKNFILDPAVKGRISIIAPSSVSVDEAYKAFLSALAINGFTVVPSGKFLKITPARNAQRDNIDTYTARNVPASDQMVTRIIKLKHISSQEVQRSIRSLVSRDGDMLVYEPTNSLIISDFGSNLRRITKIINELDQAGFEERMAVIPVRYAKAKELATLIEKVINKGQANTSTTNRFGGMFPRPVPPARGGGSAIALSLVTPDERTNSLIVVGNRDGIDKVRELVEELDFKMDTTESGGVFVYRLKHSVAETVATTLGSVTTKATSSAPTQTPSPDRPFTPPVTGSIISNDVKVVAEKNTNSLIVIASKQDYEVIRDLLDKIDIPRDQVFVEAIIMELNTDKTRDWRVASYYLDPKTHGVGRAGFSSAGTLGGLLDFKGDSGAVLGFGHGKTFTAKLGELTVPIPSVLAFVNFLQRNADANILSTPQILAMDNEEAQIEVGDQVPIGVETQTTQGGVVTAAPKFDKATIKLVITPNISPDSNTIRLKVSQSVRQASEATVRAEKLKDIATIISDRSIKTSVSVENQDTVVLGGLMRDEESHTETKVPFLGDIPVLGWLFKSRSVVRKKINLLVFLTPKIIRQPGDSRALLGQTIDKRNEWVRENVNGDDPFVRNVERLAQAPPNPPPEVGQAAPAEPAAPATGQVTPTTPSPSPPGQQ